MDQLLDLLRPLATGLLTGFLVSMPIGPINITIINEAASRGFVRAFLVGLGAATMDVIYCTMGLAGFSSMFDSMTVRAAMELVSFILVLYLGIKYTTAKFVPGTSKSAEIIEGKLHPHTAFMTGLVRVLGNPGALLMWITLSAMFVSHEYVRQLTQSKALCALGVAFGASTWFFLLSYGVSRGHGKFSSATLLRVSHFSGICLLFLAAVIGAKLVFLLSRS